MAAVDAALLAAYARLPKSYLDDNIGHRLIITAIVLLVLHTLAATLYYISKYIARTLNGLECWMFMPLSYVCCTGLCVCAILLVKLGGTGRHVEAVLLQDPSGLTLQTRSKIAKSVELIAFGAITGAKFVILSLYMRVFSTDRRYRIATYVVGTIIALNWLASLIASLSNCKPFAANWDKSIPGAKCGSVIRGYQFIGIPNIITDVMMLLLPLPALYKLQVDIGTKIGLFATFMIGSVGMVVSILRLNVFLHSTTLYSDPTYKGVLTMTYTIAESSTYLIASCLPTLRPLKRAVFGNRSISKSIGSYIASKTGTKTSTANSGFELGSFERNARRSYGHRRIIETPEDVGSLVQGEGTRGDEGGHRRLETSV